jgi:hypothetical protein
MARLTAHGELHRAEVDARLADAIGALDTRVVELDAGLHAAAVRLDEALAAADSDTRSVAHLDARLRLLSERVRHEQGVASRRVASLDGTQDEHDWKTRPAPDDPVALPSTLQLVEAPAGSAFRYAEAGVPVDFDSLREFGGDPSDGDLVSDSPASVAPTIP